MLFQYFNILQNEVKDYFFHFNKTKTKEHIEMTIHWANSTKVKVVSSRLVMKSMLSTLKYRSLRYNHVESKFMFAGSNMHA